ncbi:MAG: GNAT family N-acetyltransferase [Candidatus Gracilibacteria bacterium]|jgi:predicted GNAT family N-acyltransferase
MEESLEIKIAKTKNELQDIFQIREKVFIEEQKAPREEEFDEYDNTSEHVIVRYNKKPIGCARIRIVNGKIKLERIALLKAYRRKGFGKIIVKFLIDHSKKQNPKEIYASTQYRLLDFYTNLGFKTRGNTYQECGIKHIEMYLDS